MAYYEIAPGHSVNSDEVWRVEVTGSTVTWYTQGSGAAGLEAVIYGSPAEAGDAYDDFIAVAEYTRAGFIQALLPEITSGLLMARAEAKTAIRRGANAFKPDLDVFPEPDDDIAIQAYQQAEAVANKYEAENP